MLRRTWSGKPQFSKPDLPSLGNRYGQSVVSSSSDARIGSSPRLSFSVRFVGHPKATAAIVGDLGFYTIQRLGRRDASTWAYLKGLAIATLRSPGREEVANLARPKDPLEQLATDVSPRQRPSPDVFVSKVKITRSADLLELFPAPMSVQLRAAHARRTWQQPPAQQPANGSLLGNEIGTLSRAENVQVPVIPSNALYTISLESLEREAGDITSSRDENGFGTISNASNKGSAQMHILSRLEQLLSTYENDATIQMSPKKTLRAVNHVWMALRRLQWIVHSTGQDHLELSVDLRRSFSVFLSSGMTTLMRFRRSKHAVDIDRKFFGELGSSDCPFPALRLKRDIVLWRRAFQALFRSKSILSNSSRWRSGTDRYVKLPLPFAQFESAIRQFVSEQEHVDAGLLSALRHAAVWSVRHLQIYLSAPTSRFEHKIRRDEVRPYQYFLARLDIPPDLLQEKTTALTEARQLHERIIDSFFDTDEAPVSEPADLRDRFSLALELFSTLLHLRPSQESTVAKARPLTLQEEMTELQKRKIRAFWTINSHAFRVMDLHSTWGGWNGKVHDYCLSVALDAFDLLINHHKEDATSSVWAKLAIHDTFWLRLLQRTLGTYCLRQNFVTIAYRKKHIVPWQGPSGLRRVLQTIYAYYSVSHPGSMQLHTSIFPPALVKEHLLKWILYERRHENDELIPVSLGNVALRLDLFLGAIAATRSRPKTFDLICDWTSEALDTRTESLGWLSGRDLMGHVSVSSVISLWRERGPVNKDIHGRRPRKRRPRNKRASTNRILRPFRYQKSLPAS
ncbi:hypothetical protein BT69DRAFT_1276172 [Atractiella rhizophila]|nr:hypothetical protein BT69DRAFT_1276172 [Atractiella rhizophila]